jgi:hypothetical protein
MTSPVLIAKDTLVEMLAIAAFDALPDNEKDGDFLASLTDAYSESLDRMMTQRLWYAAEDYPPRFRQSELRDRLIQTELDYYFSFLGPESEDPEKFEHLREKYLRVIPMVAYRDTNFLLLHGIFLTRLTEEPTQ